MRRPRNAVQELHVAVLGMNGSGKSALTVKYITKRYITEYDPTIEDTYCKHELIRGQEYMLWIMDTVSGEGKDGRRYLGWADVFLVVYSITNLQSFDYARHILEEIHSHDHSFCARQHATLLLGNKTDLERYRQVSKAQGTGLATEFGAEFFEINTTEEYSLVKNVFHHGINTVISARLALAAPPSRPPSLPDFKANPNTSDSDAPSSPSTESRATNQGKSESSAPSPKSSSQFSVSWRSKSPSWKTTESTKAAPSPTRRVPSPSPLPHPPPPPTPKKGGPGLKLFKLFNN